jgi:hypothetical protein
VTIEDCPEPRRLGQRRRDDGGIGVGLHTPIFPAAPSQFAPPRTAI